MSDEKIDCQVCGAKVHAIQKHLKDVHPDVTLDGYKAAYPGAPLLSQLAERMLAERIAEQQAQKEATLAMAGSAALVEAPPANVSKLTPKGQVLKQPLHEVFKLGPVKAAMSARGEPIPISVLGAHTHEDMVPEASDAYVYNIDELKDVILALEMAIPCYVWGHKGAGKTEMMEQVSARTNRPMMRVQHTVNTEESHIIGQYTVKGGETIFELGPLAVAMQNGWVYCADEYDFAMPSVLAVYQPVLEGKALVIKEAPAALRVIRPHPNFRFVATGNTNGSGDETGLYQGTLIQNSANYDRFGMVIHKQYMDKAAESLILQNQAKLTTKDADKMVDFATLVREAYDASKMSDTISPRTLIFAARIGVMRGSFRHGLEKSFIGKLCKVDREVAGGLAQRIFGS